MTSENHSNLASSLNAKRQKKRHFPPVYNGVSNTYENKNSDFLCPICFELIEEAHITKCGHSFCYRCVKTSLSLTNRCPKCNSNVDQNDQIFPNFHLNELILKHKQSLAERKKLMEKMQVQGTSELQEFIAKESDNLDLPNVNFMLEVLVQKKQELEADCKAAQVQMLKEFLNQAKRRKREQLDQLNREMSLIETDSKQVEEMMKTQKSKYSSKFSQSENNIKTENQLHDEPANISSNHTASPSFNQLEGFNSTQNGNKQRWIFSSLATRRRRMHQHFDDLEQCYYNVRLGDGIGTNEASTSSHNSNSSYGLDEFNESLSFFTKCSHIRPLATLSYASDIFNGSSIVSSIEFDKDNEYFAIAGVTKKIKVFEYNVVVQDAVDVHYPVNEMTCNSKISCISWSSYHKSMLASSDYEGTVTVWDAFTGQKNRIFQEHEKRCWSVDFNKVDIKLIASGSDDSKVKLWSVNNQNSVASLGAKANVCCVKFSPKSKHHLAFGSADHCVHYYDLRNPIQPLAVFKGHKKAVSYVKFLNTDEIVSASTDSQLKLWNTKSPQCLRSFKGHINEKNFVGLASDGNYVSCGSENNSLYIYYKGLSKQLFTYKFDTVRSVLEKDKKDDDSNEFVSAVCWKMDSNVVVAANSQGTIKILELV